MAAVAKAVQRAIATHLLKLYEDSKGNLYVAPWDADGDVFRLDGDFSLPAISTVSMIALLQAIRDPSPGALRYAMDHSNGSATGHYTAIIDYHLTKLGIVPDVEFERIEALEGK